MLAHTMAFLAGAVVSIAALFSTSAHAQGVTNATCSHQSRGPFVSAGDADHVDALLSDEFPTWIESLHT